MKYLWALIILLFIHFTTCAQVANSVEDNYALFKKQVDSFIDRTNQRFYSHKSQRTVYYISLGNNSDTSTFCFTMRYIICIGELNPWNLNIEYVFRMDSEVILIDKDNWFNKIYYDKVNSEDIKKIRGRLCRGLLNGYGPGFASCYYENEIHNAYFENSDNLPSPVSKDNMHFLESEIIHYTIEKSSDSFVLPTFLPTLPPIKKTN